jgi:hypothetical protein
MTLRPISGSIGIPAVYGRGGCQIEGDTDGNGFRCRRDWPPGKPDTCRGIGRPPRSRPGAVWGRWRSRCHPMFRPSLLSGPPRLVVTFYWTSRWSSQPRQPSGSLRRWDVPVSVLWSSSPASSPRTRPTGWSTSSSSRRGAQATFGCTPRFLSPATRTGNRRGAVPGGPVGHRPARPVHSCSRARTGDPRRLPMMVWATW